MLLFYLYRTIKIQVGKLGRNKKTNIIPYFTFKPGWHVYFGSAQGMVRRRFNKHARFVGDNKILFYNVDHFREHATLVEASFSLIGREYECRWAKLFSRLSISSVPAERMGGADCKSNKDLGTKKCPAHFFHLTQRPPTSLLRNIFDSKPIQVTEFPTHRKLKTDGKLEWEQDFWDGRQMLERARMEYYRREETVPVKIANLSGNPVLRDLLKQ